MAEKENPVLRFLYHTVIGRRILWILVHPSVSVFVGKFMDSRLSRCLIRGFVKKNHIDVSEYQQEEYRCFNDFFCRHIRPELRPVDMKPEHLIAPCDGLLSVYRMEQERIIPVKQSAYTLRELLRSEELAKEFEDGWCLVYRLCVHHYHRYCYVDSGIKGENVFLPGKLQTVRPIALRQKNVFCENSREYTVMETEHFGRIVQMEVGALLVGKIANHDGPGPVERGKEKGTFLYGGSTVIVLLKKDAVSLTPDEEEREVKLGEWIH